MQKFFTGNTMYDEYMVCIDMKKNIVTRKFLTQKICE